MKIFSAEQIKLWDKYTITNEPITSADLMERAATACFEWLVKNISAEKKFKIFCGKGNNGGDGLVIALLLLQKKYTVEVYILETGNSATVDFETNLTRLQTLTTGIHFITSEKFPSINKNEIIVDALFGTGLNKPAENITAGLIEFLNSSQATIISIDIPSGMFADKTSKNNCVIKASYTLTFQQYKLAFLMTENEKHFGNIIILNIGLNKNFYETENAVAEFVDAEIIKSIFKPRNQFTHKGDYGHACIAAGSAGLMGAAVLSVKACLRSGAGKVTCCTPKIGYEIMQISAPEAMTKISGEDFITNAGDLQKFDSLGIGPGLGLYESHQKLLSDIFLGFNKPIVIDADALNIISKHKELLNSIPQQSIITPHTVEFERLFGVSSNDFDRMKLAIEMSHQHKIYIVLKGHHTLITTPDKKVYFNSTGNAGMATGGSGDVLTGIITGLLAQGYPSLEACIPGVYLHGLAGDIAAKKLSQEAMIAGDIIECLGDAFLWINPM